ncbi:NAD(P)H-dependent oxidoreductase [Pendulispora rubella]|uniref:NAD(P)H-dependent oxidoreductase n=1 Tax=Pendulispora rubella TaxID=2741070 RepID=A0ABZ2L907_9BACT
MSTGDSLSRPGLDAIFGCMNDTLRNDETPLKLVVVLGSVRQGRFGPVITRWFLDEVRKHGRFDIDLLDLAETPLPLALPPGSTELQNVQGRPADMIALAARLDAADAFVLVTPEYNHSFPASLKHLIDWHYTQWKAKPVSFVCYGGLGGGLRAVEQLRLVLAEMHAVGLRDVVSFDRHWEHFDEGGQLRNPEGACDAAKTLLDRLTWWGTTLREARHTRPYDSAA